MPTAEIPMRLAWRVGHPSTRPPTPPCIWETRPVQDRYQSLTGCSYSTRCHRPLADSEGRCRWCIDGCGCSTPAERIVALVFPVAALVVVGDFHRDHVFRVLETELGRHPDLHRIAVDPRQGVIGEVERQLRLRMQRRRHVERAVIAVGIRTLEPAIFRGGVGAYQLEEIA